MELIPLVLAFISGAATGVLALHRLSQYVVEETGRAPHSNIAGEDSQSLKQPQSEAPAPLAPHDPQTSFLIQDLQRQARKTEKDLEELTSSIEEVRQMLAHQHESDAEKLQDQMEVLFSTWTEALKEELQLRQDRDIQHLEEEMMAFDIKMRQLEDVSAKLSEDFDTLESMRASIQIIQGKLPELQELQLGNRKKEGSKGSQGGCVRQESSTPESKLCTGESDGVVVNTRCSHSEQPCNWKLLSKRPSMNVKSLFKAAKAERERSL